MQCSSENMHHSPVSLVRGSDAGRAVNQLQRRLMLLNERWYVYSVNTGQCNALIVIQIPSEFPFQMEILSSNAI